MKNKMICIIRIRGRVGLSKRMNETLNRLNIMRKYSCTIVEEKKEIMGMVNKVRNFVAFGKINNESFEKLIESRGQVIDNKKKASPKEIIEGLEKGKTYKELNLKPFFRLHPPRKGIKSKVHFPKGVLGNHGEKINELLERML
ncbi:50S ribosomal protein L30 [Candidatus Pacearchaeota archaeon CG10_big_fil_rev_8_21_14_0_10_34_12]|nr:MAG: 50S ribosomal protein L30 [Candidatus Pacearchaeota archaeon CG10_big_fil_rev_8_21_14_0_10_34_12]